MLNHSPIRRRIPPQRSHQPLHSPPTLGRAEPLARPADPKVFILVSWLLPLAFLISLATQSVVSAADLSEAEQLLNSGKYSECIALTSKKIEDDAVSESGRVLRIRAQLETGRYSDALKSLEDALKRYPQSIRIRWWGCDVYRFNGQPDAAETMLKEISKRIEDSPFRYRSAADSVIIGKYYLEIGEDAKAVLDRIYKPIQKEHPRLPAGFVAAGELALEKHDYKLAATHFQKALKLDRSNPEIHHSLAQAYASGDAEKSEAAIKKALEINPRHVPSLLFLVDGHIDAERYEEAEKLLAEVEKVNPKDPMCWAYRAVLAHLRYDLEAEQKAREKALAHWKKNPEVDYLIGKKLAQKYRFAEAEDYQRRALEFDPEYLPAKMQLSQDLLRLGQENEGWKLAEEVFESNPYSVMAHNLATLHDRLDEFSVLVDHGFVVRMDPQEAEIYGPRVLALLKEAKEVLCRKYRIELDEPVYVDIYPRQQDFAIRTFGMPGGAGFLGVCFGQVITMNSPAAQGDSPSNWESVLWHEFCHVVTLSKTNNRMPRWLSEGISVYEERQRNSSWGQPLTLGFRKMILEGELTPVSRLSAAFLHPKSALHLQFAYYESSLVVEYLIDHHGWEALIGILDDLGRGLTINDCLQRHTGSLEALDRGFAEYAKRQAKNLAKNADFTDPEFSRPVNEAEVRAYLQEHPDSFPALKEHARLLLSEERWEEAKAPLQKLHELYPEYIGSDSALNLLGQVHRKLGETEKERDVLSQVAELEDDVVEVYLRLAEIASQEQDWPAVVKYADQALAVNPLIKPPHRYLSDAAEKLGKDSQALGSLKALAAMEPIDRAGLSYRTARLYRRIGQLAQARRQTIRALEEAPRYRAAHRLLLEIIEKQHKSTAHPSPAIAEKQP